MFLRKAENSFYLCLDVRVFGFAEQKHRYVFKYVYLQYQQKETVRGRHGPVRFQRGGYLTDHTPKCLQVWPWVLHIFLDEPHGRNLAGLLCHRSGGNNLGEHVQCKTGFNIFLC